MRMPNNTYDAVPQPLTSDPSTLGDSVEARMNNSFRAFNDHSMSCRACRDPYEVHVSGKKLCDVGHRLAHEVSICLYNKAATTSHGTIRVGFPAGWEGVEGLLKAITKHTMVYQIPSRTDARTARTAREAGQIAYVPAEGSSSRERSSMNRGSSYEQDINRRNAGESRRNQSYHHNSSYSRPYRGSSVDPRTSLVNVASSLTPRTVPNVSPTLASASLPTPSPTPSPQPSPRVTFNPQVETRVYYP